MNKPLDPTDARQGRRGKPVLLVLLVSLVLAIVAGWVLWGAFSGDSSNALLQADPVGSAALAPEAPAEAPAPD